MKRRNFIKSTGLSLAGLAISTGMHSKNLPAAQSLRIIILLSGGLRYNDIIDAESNQSLLFFQEPFSMHVVCKTNVMCSGKALEHSEALFCVLNEMHFDKTKTILISDTHSETTKALINAQLPLEVITTSALKSVHPYRNDAAVFEKAANYVLQNEPLTLILNLDDTDVAHYNTEKYTEVTRYYNTQINALCQQIYNQKFQQKCNAKLMVASVLGRNNDENLISPEGTHHYNESAKKLFCFESSYADKYRLVYNHNAFESAQMLSSERNSVA